MKDPDGVYFPEAASRAALFEGIIASAMDAIIAVDDQFRIISINPAAETMFGVDAGAVMGQPLTRFIPERYHASHRNHVARYSSTGETHRRMGALGAVRAVRANGEEFSVEASISQSVMGGARVSAVILREVGQNAFNTEKMVLAREVDHRAKNILAIVSSLIALTSAQSKEDYVRALASRVAALSRANALLSVERWKGASLSALVSGELDAQVARARVSVAGPDMMLTARAVQPLGMLISELCTNAARHGALSTPDGRLDISWTEEAGGRLVFSWREHGGPAVAPPSSNGLGLTLIQQIVEGQLGGLCEIDWGPDGLVFEARFPSALLDYLQGERDAAALAGAPPPDPDAAASAKPPTAQSTGTLLIVEDEPILAMQLSRALSGFGWNVLGVAGSIDAANRLLAQHTRPDVAILDVDLGGVPVFPFARALRHSGIPFLFCTGFEDVAYNREFSDCTVVRKPATVLQIVAALRKTVHEAGLSRH